MCDDTIVPINFTAYRASVAAGDVIARARDVITAVFAQNTDQLLSALCRMDTALFQFDNVNGPSPEEQQHRHQH